MKIQLASVSPRAKRPKSAPANELTFIYIERASRLCPAEALTVDSEAALLALATRQPGRPEALLMLFDSHGDLATSEGFAADIARLRDNGAQRLILGIGPADGWSTPTLARAHKILSLGRMTLPHELARAVVAEQIYRALTILAGHPYHSGH